MLELGEMLSAIDSDTLVYVHDKDGRLIDSDYARDHFPDKSVWSISATVDSNEDPVIIIDALITDSDMEEARWEDKRNEARIAADFKCDQARDIAMEVMREMRT